eukprot:m.113893 g.113893  ORF g.113893 m.113893 type:complete len:264 (+) comp9433_c0_seq2:448-1239(+)
MAASPPTSVAAPAALDDPQIAPTPAAATVQDAPVPEPLTEEMLMRRRVFVGNMPRACTLEKLREFLAQKFGPLRDANIIRDRESDVSKGYGFVTFETEKQAQDCIAKKQMMFMGRQLNFGPARRRDRRSNPVESRSRNHGRTATMPEGAYYYPPFMMPMQQYMAGMAANGNGEAYYPFAGRWVPEMGPSGVDYKDGVGEVPFQVVPAPPYMYYPVPYDARRGTPIDMRHVQAIPAVHVPVTERKDDPIEEITPGLQTIRLEAS